MTSATPRADLRDVHACRELLRHLNHPRRLRENVIVRRILAAENRDARALPDAALVAAISTIVEAAIERLPARQQTIVRRCDIGGDRYRDVARVLFISERHAFRERDAAVAFMLTHFGHSRLVAQTETATAADGFRLRLAHAQALESNGNWQIAVDVLERLRADAADTSGRCYIETRLAQVYEGVGRLALAGTHVDNARRLAERIGDRTSWEHAEVDIAAANLAVAVGDAVGGERVARRSCAELESWLQTSTEPRIRDALIDGLTLRAALSSGRGELDPSVKFASRACELVADSRLVDAQLAIAARTMSAAVEFLRGGDGERAVREMLCCYELATAVGLTREAVITARYLATSMRATGRPVEAMHFLAPLVPTARAVAIGAAGVAFFCELVSCSVESRDLEAAARYLPELQERCGGNSFVQAFAEMVSGKVHLARREYVSALRCAEDAESGFTRLGQDRLVGAALRLQAQALARLGQRERALKSINLAIEMLAGKSHPARLAGAYRVLAGLSGDTRHVTIARRLLRN